MEEPSLADWLNGTAAEPAPVATPAPIGDYGALEGLNWSTLRHLWTSPKLLRWRVDHPREDTEALELGRATHCAMLEPERWASSYIARPDFGDMRTKIAKAARDEWTAKLAPGLEVLDADEHALAERCARSVHAHPSAFALLRGGRAEKPIQWVDELGVKCKARPDYVRPTSFADLKSTRRSTVREMTRDIATLLYHGQLAFYFDGLVAAHVLPADAECFVVAVQTVEPYDVVPFRVGFDSLERGRRLYRALLEKYVACEAAGWWPGLAPEVIPLQLPPWAAGGTDEEEVTW